MFLIDIIFKGCQGRSNRSSIVHVVSYFACGVIDTACIVHAVSLTPHAFVILFAYHHCFAYDFNFSKLFYKCSMRCLLHPKHRACSVNDTACILKNSNIFANSNLYSKRV
jgi:hypothetical protein